MKQKQNRRPAALRALAASLAVVAVTFTVLFASDLITGDLSPKTWGSGVVPTPDTLRAMTVRTQDNADFPSAPGLPAKVMKAELEEMAAFANTYGYNAIFFEAVPEGDAFYKSKLLPASAFWTGEQGGFTFFDPLAYLVGAAREYGIQVYAVVDPFGVAAGGLAASSPAVKNPGWVKNDLLDPSQPGVRELLAGVAKELSAYDIAGVVLSNVDSKAFDGADYAGDLAKIAAGMRGALREPQRLGMVVSGEMRTADGARDLVETPAKEGSLDFVVPIFEGGPTDPEQFTAELSSWEGLGPRVAYYPLHRVSDSTAFSHEVDNSRLYELQAGADGLVISNYGALNTDSRAAAYSLAATFAWQTPTLPEMSWPRTLAITRPEQTLTVSPSVSAYFVTGTSDPSKPLYYKGQELERGSKTGLWGALVDVPYGTNTYEFSQDGVSKSISIVRPQPSGVSTINAIVKSSAYPANPEAVLDSALLKLSCTAPAGGTVSASVGGLSAALSPVSSAQNGTPVVYQATLDISSLAPAGQVKKVGPVTYSLNYGGMASTQQSAGEVYASGAGAKPVVRMSTFMVPVSRNGAEDGDYSTLLKQGSTDFIAENPGGGYYRLASGGYVLKSKVEIPEGAVTAVNKVSSISMQQVPKGEKLTITGTSRPVFHGEWADDKLVLTLYNLEGFQYMNTSLLESRLCTSIDSQVNDDGSATLTFHLSGSANLLGWDVQFEGSDTVIYLKRRPAFHAETATPLSEVTVVLDPGHGGADPGAAGIPYSSGPWEKTLNLANAYALKARLEALGATVYITQEDETMTLDARMELSAKYDADIFISNHHNSLAETVDSNGVSGIEVYYYTDQSALLAELAGASLAEDTGRKLRFTDQSWYRVTMMTACPAILLESGYICNPQEYEGIATDYGMYVYGNAVADAVLHYFRQG